MATLDDRNRRFSRTQNALPLAGFAVPTSDAVWVSYAYGVSNGGPDPYAWPALSTAPVAGAWMFGDDSRSGNADTVTPHNYVPIGGPGLRPLVAQNVTQGTPVGDPTTIGGVAVPPFTILTPAQIATMSDHSIRIWGENFQVAEAAEFLRLGKLRGCAMGSLVVASSTLSQDVSKLQSLIAQMSRWSDRPVRVLDVAYHGGETNTALSTAVLKGAYEGTLAQFLAASASAFPQIHTMGIPNGQFTADFDGGGLYGITPARSVLEMSDDIAGVICIGPHINDEHSGDHGHLSAAGAIALGKRRGAIKSHLLHERLNFFPVRIIETVTVGAVTTISVAADSLSSVVRPGDTALVTGSGFSGRDGPNTGDVLTANSVAIAGTVIAITWNRAPNLTVGGIYHAGTLSGGLTNIRGRVAGIDADHWLCPDFLPWNYQHPFLASAPATGSTPPDQAQLNNNATQAIDFSGTLYAVMASTMRLTNGARVRTMGVARTAAGTVWVGVGKRVSPGAWNIIALESYSHPGGNVFIDHTFTAPVDIPNDGGDYYPVVELNGSGWGVVSSARAFASSTAPTTGSRSMTEDTSTTPGVRVNY